MQQGATTLVADILRKKAELTAVVVEHVPAASWKGAASRCRPLPTWT